MKSQKLQPRVMHPYLGFVEKNIQRQKGQDELKVNGR